MRILITNDDGIDAEGIQRLAVMAKQFGEVWVVAPDGQCSAMSQKITIREKVSLRKEDVFPVKGVEAYRVGGTPADCVKIALEYLMPEKPDIVFSGINNGYNAGIEVCYSGTVAAAMEALLKGIPAIAFSLEYDGQYDVVKAKLSEIAEELIKKPAGKGKIWNVNFPGCGMEKFQGILWNRTLAHPQYFMDDYVAEKQLDDTEVLSLQGRPISGAEKGTDLQALLDGYISIGTIANCVLAEWL